jgi:hypothetical protein
MYIIEVMIWSINVLLILQKKLSILFIRGTLFTVVMSQERDARTCGRRVRK